MEIIKEILIRRDCYNEKEADDLIFAARKALQSYLDLGDIEGAKRVYKKYFELKPDFVIELLQSMGDNKNARD